VALKNRSGDRLTGTRDGGLITGSLTVQGHSWTFSLPSVAKPSGLYRATAKVRGATVVAGWVVLPDGTQVGAWSRDGRDVAPAPAVDLATGQVIVDGAALTATPPDPAATTF
jgi:serine/threonine-protein kinase